MREPGTVVIDDDRLALDPTGAEVLDADGGVLLPGLIDAHVHLTDQGTLRQLGSCGVTTALDMATWSAPLVESLRNTPGLTDIRSSGLPAIGAGGPHSHMPGMPPEALVLEPAHAEPFVAARVSENADYIKIVTEAPGAGGPDQATLDALVAAAHRHGKRTIAHAASTGAYDMALAAGVDMITHAPLDRPLDAATVARIVDRGVVIIPTLTMMHGIAAATGADYTAAESNITALHRAGAVILAGTDANASPGAPERSPTARACTANWSCSPLPGSPRWRPFALRRPPPPSASASSTAA